jgi:hypothetical protein
MENEAKEKKTGAALPEGITQAMVSEAKRVHGADRVKIIELPLGDDVEAGYRAVLATVPTRNVIGQYRRWADTDPKRADEILVKNSMLSHKDEVLADDGLFYGALSAIADLIPVRKGIIKNC